jgi:hypothetical protein
MKIKLLLLGFVLFAGIMANGQQRKISGTVTSSDNGDVLIGGFGCN